ncbi:MAG: hypothetical protein HY903_15770 [Deltaproteobacteria bacterium]|nr:hypothetical protein [Deltaproteobacteria bacterium]
MTVQRIDRINERAALQQVETERYQQRLNLFNVNSFERVGGVEFADGSRIDIPSMTDSDREAAARLFASVPVDKQPQVDQASQDLAKAVYAASASGLTAGGASTVVMPALTNAAQAYVTATGLGTNAQVGSSAANNAFMGTMYMGLVGLEGDLEGRARDLQSRNQLADDLRTDMTEIRNELADWPDDGSTKTFSWTEVKADGTIVEHTNEALTKAQAEALLKNLDEQLAGVRDMNELARFDLQKNMQDYQQALQTFSGILKESHDQMMRTINNLKA